MKMLLTGGSGFLGKEITKYFKNGDIISMGRSNSDIICDLSTQIPNVLPVDLVVHAAGKAHSVPNTDAEKQEFYDVNVKGTENLLKGIEQAYSLPKAFIFISSVSVYGAESGIGIDENQALAAIDAYGHSKIQAEKIVEDWCLENNVICGILRLPLLVGPNPPGNLGAMIKGIRNGYYFNVGGGKARKSMVMADDVAAIITKVAQVGGIYNLTDGTHPSFNELSAHISNQLNKKPILNMPVGFAKTLAKIGDLVPQFPLNSKKLEKITSDLTFNDDKARSILAWSPRSVLDSFKL
ncbi:NAD(P)-dependent oxidoreductase [Pedobacter sp. UBA4863]|uniref:NAD-dependent epimerase/dehydratase family protein n=1 Tax=Pedobacter sp. UBA4863 TaxID=1947060 RepID=UPI0025D1798C|nr:NAD-dependent epimerase/dehydratase family protein [Pedobacter sp. UBA4863]